VSIRFMLDGLFIRMLKKAIQRGRRERAD